MPGFGTFIVAHHRRALGAEPALGIGGEIVNAVDAGEILEPGDVAADLVGTASRLHSPADINGIYSAIGAGLAVAGGRTSAQLSNANGVVLRLHGRQVGFSFSIDLAGMSISLG